MSYRTDYCYCDANYEDSRTGKTKWWQRMKVSDVPERIVHKTGAINCYMTVQRFKESTSARELDKAIQWAKKDMELDSSIAKAREEDKGVGERLADLEAQRAALELPDMQMHYCGLYFDFDADFKKLGCSEEEALGLAKAQTQQLVDWFHAHFDLNPAHLQIWFSGKKGFHVIVRPEVFGIRPNRFLNLIVKLVAQSLAAEMSLTTLDLTVYSVERMWRIPGTAHPSTGRYKVELDHLELARMTVAEIIDLAKQPRGYGDDPGHVLDSVIYEEEEYTSIVPDPEASRWWKGFWEIWSSTQDLIGVRPMAKIKRPSNLGKNDLYPACVKDIMANGEKEGGPGRNRTLLPVAGFLKDSGRSEKEAYQLIDKWTADHYGHQPNELKQRISNGRSVVYSAYHGNTSFACKFIRSCKGTGKNGVVDCVREENCSWIQNPEDQDQDKVHIVPLGEASKACYHETRVRIPVHVATVAKAPYQLPHKGTMECAPDPEAKICSACPNNIGRGDGKMEWTVSSGDRDILNLFGVPDNHKLGTIKQKCGISRKCFKVHVNIQESASCEELQIIPMVDFAKAYDQDDSEDEIQKQAQHVVRSAFHVGHGIESNKKYVIEASVLGHPKDQSICFLFDKKESAQNDIDSFEMTPELYQSLCQFQPEPGQSVEDKIIDIHNDLLINVHRIGGRRDLAVAVDLCYHSVVGFTFASTLEEKGWFELLVVGDTGTGKSTLVKRMQKHFSLGEMIAGEGARRTALLSANIQMHNSWVLQWGKLPQNDRRLLIIDEFGDIPKEEVGKLTQVRSSGMAQGLGVNAHYETFARTRLICISNPVDNDGSLQGFSHGINAIRGIYGVTADLRRVDLAVIADKTDVSIKLANKRWDLVKHPHVYTSDMCRNLILWVWSRDPRHIVFTPDAVEAVINLNQKLADTYDCDISLAERSDFKIKLARISAAVAARMFSTDKDAKKVYVRSEHVEFAATFMDSCYRKPSMAYFEYARQYKRDNEFTAERRRNIKLTMDMFENSEYVMRCILDLESITKNVLADMVSLDHGDLLKLWKFITSNRLIIRNGKSYKKTAAFTKFLQAQDNSRKGNESSSKIMSMSGLYEEEQEEEDFEVSDLPQSDILHNDDEPDF